MRGKPPYGDAPLEHARIIPARAGQTWNWRHPPTTTPDHPRACGANLIVSATHTRNVGSSPRVRGKHGLRVSDHVSLRIIPARAGQTRVSVSGLTSTEDHPRACGANCWALTRVTNTAGSSPRVRGKLHGGFHEVAPSRIIPARAGQTVRFYAKTLERWTLNNWIRTVAPIFVLLFLLPVIGQNAYIERHYSNQSFSWFSKLHYASAFDLSLVA